MANDITILSCPICYNPKLREYGNGIYQCDVCETYFDKNENIVLTEQEWLQTANTEQLAKWLAHHSRFIYECGEKKITPKTMYEEDWEWWLKQPHTTIKE